MTDKGRPAQLRLGSAPPAPLERVVNVASVPMRSPFRYPGGKTWLVPIIRQWLGSRSPRPREFIEPFAGGGTVGLTVAFERLADRVLLVELDDDVAAVWRTILCGDAEWLADKISSFQPTPESVRNVLEASHTSVREKAFATIIRNRVNRGGILAPGAGLMKLGENGKGLASRWYPKTLCRRILAIAALRDRIAFVRGDGLAAMRDDAGRTDVAFFVDPPYVVAGRRLYRHNAVDHERLFQIASGVRGDMLMSYDDTAHIRALAARHGFQVKPLPMKTTHHRRKTELVIARRLDWLGG